MEWLELGLAFVTAAVGALGGLGGAILLVPALVLTGTSPRARPRSGSFRSPRAHWPRQRRN